MSRILNRQRQLAEQGRLRLGYTVPAKTRDGRDTTRPVRSETWIVTSHSREHIEHAASLWGGEATEWEPMGNGAKQWRVITTTAAIPAILPPGDPLTQSYEQWNRGGCVRRCDGVTEELSGSPCICLAQHGEQWYELSAREVCGSKSRLKVLLPDMPGLGSWRMETGSFYATDEIAGMVDTIRGAVGDSVLVPVTLRIEPRTRVAGGDAKQFVVPVVELRGVTAGALLSGQAVEMGALRSANLDSQTPAAIQAADPFVDHRARVEKAESLDELSDIWRWLVAEKMVGEHAPNTPQAQAFVEAWKAKAAALKAAAAPAEQPASAPAVQPDEDGAYPAEIVEDPPTAGGGDAPTEPNPDAVWQQIVTIGGRLNMTLPQITEDCTARLGGVLVEEASGTELGHYLKHLQTVEAQQGAGVPA